jgi:hypothetical protein
MIIVILTGVWHLSLIVSSLHIQITLSDDELKVYEELNNIYKNKRRREIHILMKYLILHKRLKRPIQSNFIKYLRQYIQYKEMYRTNKRMMKNIYPLQDKIKQLYTEDHFKTQELKNKFTFFNQVILNKVNKII